MEICIYLNVIYADIALLDGVDGVSNDDNDGDCDDGSEEADDQQALLRAREVGHAAVRALPPARRVGARTATVLATVLLPNLDCRCDTNQSVALCVIREP